MEIGNNKSEKEVSYKDLASWSYFISYYNYPINPNMPKPIYKPNKEQQKFLIEILKERSGNEETIKILKEVFDNINEEEKNNYYNNKLNNLNSNIIQAKKGEKGKEKERYNINQENIIENALNLSKRSKEDSKRVQNLYSSSPIEIKYKIYLKLKPEIKDLIRHNHASFVLLEMIKENVEVKNNKEKEKIDKEIKDFIFKSIEGDIYGLSKNNYGCFLIEEFLKLKNEEYLKKIYLELKDYSELIKNEFGNHVVQHFIKISRECGKADYINNIIDEINFIELSKHNYGSWIIEKLLENSNENQYKKITKKLLDMKEVNNLIKDRFGNNVIKAALKNNKNNLSGEYVEPIYKALKKNIKNYSKDMYACFVVEAAYQYGNEKQKKDILDEIYIKNDSKNYNLIELGKNEFGNHIIQNIYKFCNDDDLRKIIENVFYTKKNLNKYSKHIKKLIDKEKNSNK